MNIKDRLEDYLKLVTTTDPSNVLPLDDIQNIVIQPQTSSHESFGIIDRSNPHYKTDMQSPVPRTLFP